MHGASHRGVEPASEKRARTSRRVCIVEVVCGEQLEAQCRGEYQCGLGQEESASIPILCFHMGGFSLQHFFSHSLILLQIDLISSSERPSS